MKKLFLSAVLIAAVFLLSGVKKSSNDLITVKVGALLSLTGNWSTLGLTSQEAMNLAVKEINDRMEETGCHYRFSVTIFDTKLDTSIAKAAISEAIRNNIRYVIGPQSSSEVKAISDFANANGILVVSQGSTAGSLAIPGDAIFRFCPGDNLQADAIAQAIYGSGRRSLITISTDDVGNLGLQQAIGKSFLSRNGTVDALTPWIGQNSDFSPLLKTLKMKLQQRVKQVGPDKVAVYLSSFDIAKELFRQASMDPFFSTVHWYGGDGIALSSELLADADASSFAVATHFQAPTLALPQQVNPSLSTIAEAIKNKTGLTSNAYSLAVYDALWVVARTVCAFPEPTNDFTKIKDVFQKEANQYYGITGPMYMNAAGDRSKGNFDYWGIVNEGGTYKWKWVGRSL
ncbi:MAG TPA: ABC transporter substrate-binding protein [Hanamia sp.]|nr:ABC transporter substrate-binding protein [Hanamia sp.]